MTFEQIKRIIGEFDWTDQFFHEDEPTVEYAETEAEREALTMLGKFEEVEHFGGEGKGDEYWTVYRFIDHNLYIQFDGWYASHNGSEYSDMFEVEPKEVTEIKYLRKD